MDSLKQLNIRWALHRDESEPTTRQRGLFIIWQLQKRGYNCDKWDGKEHADIIVLQYNMRDLDAALATGAVVVQDVNDQVFADHHSECHKFHDNINRVHAVVAGTERLAQHLRRMHPFVRVIQEPVDARYLAVEKKQHNGLNITWCGMDDNLRYFDEIDPVLQQLAKNHQFTMNVVCPPLDGKKQSNAEKVRQKPYPSKFHAWTMETLCEQMALADIAVVPLSQDSWSMCKSPNKVLSFMAAGIPVVASDVIPYRGVIRHGQNGFLCLHSEDWRDALSGLLTDEPLRAKIGVGGKITAMQFRVEEIAQDWVGLFKEIRPC